MKNESKSKQILSCAVLKTRYSKNLTAFYFLSRKDESMKKAFAYLRVSHSKQSGEDKDGFRRQSECISEYAKKENIEIVETYADAISGTKGIDSRPKLGELLDAISCSDINVIIVERTDRIARCAMTGEIMFQEFKKQNIRVILAETGQEWTQDDSATARMVRGILGHISQFEKDVLVEKLRAARERIKREKGKCEGRKAYGEKAGEEKTLAAMKKLLRKPRKAPARSYQKVADAMNEKGIQTRYGKKWSGSAVRQIAVKNNWR